LDYLIWAATHLSQDDLVRRFGVKPKRAGTLLAGAVVFRAVMSRFGFFEIFVSEYGIRDGAILAMGREDAATPEGS
jgi:exopolyphosphatase/guanosine-5'-triphosphate,3'-diphosphate pyrophosphatase